jgi:hypothetical protein
MTSAFSRRSLIAGAGYAVAAGSVAGSLLSVARAAEEQGESAICLSMVYQNDPKAKFDAKAFKNDHLPLLKSAYGSTLERVELRMPGKPRGMGGGSRASENSNIPSQAPTPMGPPPMVLAAVSLWISDLKGFGEKTIAAGDSIGKGLAAITEVQPTVQYDKVLVLLGENRSAVPDDASVFSTYFPAQQGGNFDAKYYGEKVIPLMVQLYGAKTIRRIEFSIGSKGQNGAPPRLLGAAHYYIRDRAAWDAAAMKAFQPLMAEGPKYTTVRPVVADMQVVASG